MVATNIHEPSDSSLLSDGVRILTRLMVNAKKKLNVLGIEFSDRSKAARILPHQVFYIQGMAKKENLYIDPFVTCRQGEEGKQRCFLARSALSLPRGCLWVVD